NGVDRKASECASLDRQVRAGILKLSTAFRARNSHIQTVVFSPQHQALQAAADFSDPGDFHQPSCALNHGKIEIDLGTSLRLFSSLSSSAANVATASGHSHLGKTKALT